MTIRKGKSIIAGNGAAAIANENRVGLVKPDNETIQIDQEGTISAIIPEVEIPEINTDLFATKEDIANMATKDEIPEVITSYNDLTDKPEIPAPYELPIASTDILGGVKVDGETISILNGVISAINAGGSSEWEVSVNSTGWYAKHMSSGLIIQGLVSAWSSTEGKGSFNRTFTFKTPFKTKVLFSWGNGTISNGMYGYMAPTLTLTNVKYSYSQTGNSSYSEQLFLIGY